MIKNVLVDEGITGEETPANPTFELNGKVFSFKEWNTQADGAGEVFTKDTPVKEDIIVYAIWEEQPLPEEPEDSDEPIEPPVNPGLIDIVLWSGGNSLPGPTIKEKHEAYFIRYPDVTVKPQNTITRAEVATIFFRLLDDTARENLLVKTNNYTDVEAYKWYNTAISILANAKINSF